MSILHTVNTSPLQTHALQQCLNLVAEGDSLLLIEDAVIGAHATHSLLPQLKQLAAQQRLFVAKNDLAARGIENIIGTQCDTAQFVALVVQHQSQMAW